MNYVSRDAIVLHLSFPPLINPTVSIAMKGRSKNTSRSRFLARDPVKCQRVWTLKKCPEPTPESAAVFADPVE